jgi:hypothetical protein
MSSITGWGRGTWGSGPWNSPDTINPSGVAITAGVGTATTTVSNQPEATGQAITAVVVKVTANIGTNANVTGNAITVSAARLFLYFQIDTSQTPNYTPIER